MKRRYFVLIEILMDLSILYEIMRIYCIILLSLPSWERGLKLHEPLLCPLWGRSLPSWERGLKLSTAITSFLCDLVAPFVGAWIEISLLLLVIFA